MRAYFAAPLAGFAGLGAEKALERVGADWLPAFLIGLIVIAVVLLLASGRRAEQ